MIYTTLRNQSTMHYNFKHKYIAIQFLIIVLVQILIMFQQREGRPKGKKCVFFENSLCGCVHTMNSAVFTRKSKRLSKKIFLI